MEARRHKASCSMPAASREPRWRPFFVCVLIFGLTLLIYAPALRGGFVWDDDRHVTRAELRSLDGLLRIWSEAGSTQQYYPALHTAFWLEHRLWGDAPLGYHFVNVFLHATAACLLGAILWRLHVRGAWFAALLFAVHPVCVESVAWISEQKNTLSIVFYLCAALLYLRFDEYRRPFAYACATAVFALALLTKSVTASLPAALLVILWWRHGRLSWTRDAIPLAPWLVMGAVSGLLTAWLERTMIGAQGEAFALTALQRSLLAGRVVWFYIGKLIWPADLAFIYPRWPIDPSVAWQYAFPAGILLLAGVAFCARQRIRGSFAAALIFTGTLFPVLGFLNVYPFLYSFVADHFQYLACPTMLALIGAGFRLTFERHEVWTWRSVCGLLLFALGMLTWRQCGTYRDVFTLYETTPAKNPSCWMAHNNLARALVDAGRIVEAVPHLEKALALRPNYAEAESNLGDTLTRLGRPREAIPHLERALRLRSDYPEEIHNNLGIALAALGRRAEAVAHFQEALRVRPVYPIAHFNLGFALLHQGHVNEAILHFEEAIRLNADFREAHLQLVRMLRRIGRVDDAARHEREANRLQPDGTSGAGR